MRQGLLVLRSQHPRINTHNSPGCAVLTTPARRFFLASLGHTLTALLSGDPVIVTCGMGFVLGISGNVDAAERISAIASRSLRIHLQDDEPNAITMAHVLSPNSCANDHADCHFLVDSARADLALGISAASRLIELPQGVEIDVTNVDSTMRVFLERSMPSFLLEFGGMPWPVCWAARIGRVAGERGGPGPRVSKGLRDAHSRCAAAWRSQVQCAPHGHQPHCVATAARARRCTAARDGPSQADHQWQQKTYFL